jgi:hypothetical protein
MKVLINGNQIGTIKQGVEYWEYTPSGSTEPSLRAHGVGGLKLMLSRWLGSQLSFDD